MSPRRLAGNRLWIIVAGARLQPRRCGPLKPCHPEEGFSPTRDLLLNSDAAVGIAARNHRPGTESSAERTRYPGRCATRRAEGNKMIAYLTLEIRIEAAHSLKDKRQVVRSVKDGLRAHFNVAVAELDASDAWQRATLGRGQHLRLARLSGRSDAQCGAPCHAGGQQ